MRNQISVIVPAYNAEQYLAECLDSILAQSVPGLEVIVVDDGSTDGTPDIAARYGGAIRYVWQPNSGGCSSPRNHGARLATGEFFAFFDADDIMCVGRLSAQLQCMRKDPALGLVLVDYQNFDSVGTHDASQFAGCIDLLKSSDLRIPGGSATLRPPTSNRLLIRENYASACSILIRRDAWHFAGGFDETLLASEDFDLVYRIARNWPIGLLGIVGTRRRLHSNNMSKATVRILGWKVASREKLLQSETDEDLRRELRRSIAAFELARSRALNDASLSGARLAYLRAIKSDFWLALKQWRVLARTLVPALRPRDDQGPMA